MFGKDKESEDALVTKSITRKYKNTKITILDAKYRKGGREDTLLDEDKIDRLLSGINKLCEATQSKYNPYQKRIIIANDDQKIERLFKREQPVEEEEEEELKENDFIDIYEPEYNLSDVYMNNYDKQNLISVINTKQYERILYERWGFKSGSKGNRAVILNFFGPPGTGKSMAAEAVAKYLGKKLYSINYSELESKYVGQTPKNIKKAFERAKKEDAVLVFDEADSFLGKRLTNISQSADYGVNITRSVMLLELEKFEGVVIFTTNLMENYDEAFKRRILASIQFKLPDEEGRKAIFASNLPETLPVSEDITPEKLADKFKNVSGADIKDIIFVAAINAIEKRNKMIGTVEEIEKNRIISSTNMKTIEVETSDTAFNETAATTEDEKRMKEQRQKRLLEDELAKAVVTMNDFEKAYVIVKNRYN